MHAVSPYTPTNQVTEILPYKNLFVTFDVERSENIYQAKRGSPSSRTSFKLAVGWRQKLLLGPAMGMSIFSAS